MKKREKKKTLRRSAGRKKQASGDPKLRISNSPSRMHVLLKVRRRAVRSGRRAPQAAPGLESLRSRSEGREALEEAARPPARSRKRRRLREPRASPVSGLDDRG